jgi:enolase
MKFKGIELKQVLDSRGEPTIEVVVIDEAGASSRASVPSGKSRASREVAVFGFAEAERSLEKLKPEFLGREFNSVAELDNFLKQSDGTSDKSRLGGNFTLAVSVAVARALADFYHLPLWQFLEKEFFSSQPVASPLIFANLINGGSHAKNNLALQEYLVVINTTGGMQSSIDRLIEFYRGLGERLKEKIGRGDVPLGDEGGYALDFSDNFEPLQILEEEVLQAGLEKEFSLGLDVAASSFFQGNNYCFADKNLSAEELLEVYADYFRRAKLLKSIEDPFAEDDVNGFKKLQARFVEKLIIGDDLTVTNAGLIRQWAQDKAISGVIIKPNQIGTITETAAAIKTAQEFNLKTIISHRSGETEDNFIIHLAKAAGADGVKIGAPVKSRLSKYDELTHLYQ